MQNENYETIPGIEPQGNEPKTHDTFVIGLKNGRIIFLKSYDYIKQQEEAQSDLSFVQDKSRFDGWYISHAGSWILESKRDEGDRFPISVPMP